ncbi:MFS transporter [Psychromicrobium lacuslunae]|uniref:MFS transporter n=1 Tax=Psychromicrobium lacuslunae TaxID=1618207 RepID=UPI0009E38B40|nr:MFS transporter [Psychromicrobium lacuslunae]
MTTPRPALTPTTTRTGSYWLMAVLLGLALAVSGIPSPLYARYAAEWGFSSLMLTVVFAAYAIAALISLLIVGPITDAIGRKPVLLTAAGLILIGLVVFVTAQNVVALLAARIVHGAAIGAVVVAAGAAMLDLRPADGARTGRITGVAFSIGMAVGIFGTALAAEMLPAPLVTPFLMVGGVMVLVTIALILTAETHTQRSRARIRLSRPSVPGLIRTDFSFSVLGAAASWVVLGLYLSLFPTLAAQETGIHSLIFSAGVIAVLTISSALTQWLLGGLSARLLAISGDALMAISILLSIPVILSGSPTLIILSVVLLGAGFGLAFSGSFRHLNSVIPAEARGGVISAFYLCCYLAMAVPAVLAGWAATGFALATVFTVFAVVVALLCALAALLGFRVHRATTSAGSRAVSPAAIAAGDTIAAEHTVQEKV